MNLVLGVTNLDSVIESWAKCCCLRDVDRPCIICSIEVISGHRPLALLADAASLAHEASYADRCCSDSETKVVTNYELQQSCFHYSCS